MHLGTFGTKVQPSVPKYKASLCFLAPAAGMNALWHLRDKGAKPPYPYFFFLTLAAGMDTLWDLRPQSFFFLAPAAGKDAI